MKPIILLLAACAATSVSAAETQLTIKTVDKTAPLAKAAARPMIPPTVSATTVTRRADGSLSLNCVQKANPKLLSVRGGQSDGAKP